MSSSRDYWIDRDKQRYLRYINQVKKIDSELNGHYSKSSKELKKQIAILQSTVIANNSLSNQAKLQLAEETLIIVETVLYKRYVAAQ